MKRLPDSRRIAWRQLSRRYGLWLCLFVIAQITPGFVSPALSQADTGPAEWIDSAAASSAGMSAVRLKRVQKVFDDAINDGHLAGAVLAVMRNDQKVLTAAFGYLDTDRRLEMPVDAVFDLSTLTQPVTVAAAVSWQEQAGWLLTDPLGKYLEPFERRSASLWDVIRQTDGFATAIDPSEREPGRQIRPSQKWTHSLDAALRMTGDSFIRQVAREMPAYPPGLVARQGFSLDLLGLALEKSSQQTLGTFFLRHLFIPLDMWDTGFNPPAGLETRLVSLEHSQAAASGERPVRDPRDRVIFECGGACLTGTAPDYLRFAQMLLKGGRIGQQQILSRPSVEMMKRNQLATATENRLPALIQTDELQAAEARSGLGLALVPAGVPLPVPLNAGDFGTASPGGSFFWISPVENLVVVMLASIPDEQVGARLQQQIIGLIAQSIVE